MQGTLKTKTDQIQALLTQCLENAELLRTQLNQRLADFSSVQTRLDGKKAEITNGLNDYDVQLQQIADAISTLGAQVLALEKQKLQWGNYWLLTITIIYFNSS